jgi:CheY-like chemotaxis protein
MKTVDELSSTAPVPTPAGISVLVVDDEAAVRRFAARVLESEGYVVVEAKDGIEALDLFKDVAISIEMVVSDIVMPRLNGVELMRALAVSHPDLPVILMSGYATGALAVESTVPLPSLFLFARPSHDQTVRPSHGGRSLTLS